MSDYLVIVESPAKAKTIEKYLGKKYKVKASMGHVRDLPKSQTGVDVDNNVFGLAKILLYCVLNSNADFVKKALDVDSFFLLENVKCVKKFVVHFSVLLQNFIVCRH